MQKKLIALAIAGLASSAAFAQSNVTVYGFMDMGVINQSRSDKGVKVNQSKTSIASGVSAGDRIGFKGAEALGNGTSAIFEHELQIYGDAGNLTGSLGNMGTRHSYVGLTGGWGTAVAGYVDGARFGVACKYDAFSCGTVGQGVSIQKHASRADNAIAYISPSWSGFSFIAAYTTQLIGQEAGTFADGNGNKGDGRLWAIQPNYNNGPIALTLNFEHLDVKDAANDNGDVSIAAMGGSYDFKVVKIMGYWENVHTEGNRAWDQRAWTLGATAPVGANGLVRLNYSRLDDKTVANADCDKWGIGYKHSLSKRTYVFTDYGRINNKNATSVCTIAVSGSSGSLDNGGAGPTGGCGTAGFDLGLAHSF
jgi:predicted porin